MLRKILTLDKAYFVEWTPNEVCHLLSTHGITAGDLVQSNKGITKKLIKDFFLLACRASLSSSKNEYKKATTLRHYAKAINQISNDYEDLFGRTVMTEAVTENETVSSDETVINTIDRMQARLFYLTTQYSLHPCTHIANHIVDLLTRLCKHPNIELLPAQHYIYSQSINYWRSCLIKNKAPRTRAELH